MLLAPRKHDLRRKADRRIVGQPEAPRAPVRQGRLLHLDVRLGEQRDVVSLLPDQRVGLVGDGMRRGYVGGVERLGEQAVDLRLVDPAGVLEDVAALR